MSPKPVRRSQIIAPFGVGAMVDFTGPTSLISCGLDAWPTEKMHADSLDEFKIADEPRLARRLNVEYFLIPPDFRRPRRGQPGSPNMNIKMPFLRFPLVHACPRCGLMYEASHHDLDPPFCSGPIGTGAQKGQPHNRRRTVQVRFVACCPAGHMRDFPWREWIHKSATDTCAGRLRMRSTGSSSLAGVTVACESCGKSRNLAGAFDTDSEDISKPTAISRLGIQCCGEAPWLAIPSQSAPAPSNCGQHLRLLLRGSAGVYFPKVLSSLFLPTIDAASSSDALKILDDYHSWQYITMTLDMAEKTSVTTAMAEKILKNRHPDSTVTAEELAQAANRKLTGQTSSAEVNVAATGEHEETAFRRQEWTLLRGGAKGQYHEGDLMVRVRKLDQYESVVRENFQCVALIHKLRETRAFAGFSRVIPDNGLDTEARKAMLTRPGVRKRWLPASLVRGEGIYLELNDAKLKAWENKQGLDGVGSRISLLNRHFDPTWVRAGATLSARFILLHTLAHLLMNQLVYECGYGSASLRERLYCSDPPADSVPAMNGILIYTAAGDSEGTMGGLVRMGAAGNLEAVLRRALDKARWCSTDPVCMESNGQGPDNSNLAACHCCALVPETSCEQGNRMLDRASVIGTLSNPSMGFFPSQAILLS